MNNETGSVNEEKAVEQEEDMWKEEEQEQREGGGEYHPVPGSLKFCLFFKDSQHAYVIDFGLILLVTINFLSFPCSSSSISTVVLIRGTSLESLS